MDELRKVIKEAFRKAEKLNVDNMGDNLAESYLIDDLIKETREFFSTEINDESYQVGYDEGHEYGEESGYDNGYESGHDDGYEEGRRDGYDEGHETGYQEGLEEKNDEN